MNCNSGSIAARDLSKGTKNDTFIIYTRRSGCAKDGNMPSGIQLPHTEIDSPDKAMVI